MNGAQEVHVRDVVPRLVLDEQARKALLHCAVGARNEKVRSRRLAAVGFEVRERRADLVHERTLPGERERRAIRACDTDRPL